MKTIVVKHTFSAPIQNVFDAYTDHASWSGVGGIRSAVVTKPGDLELNGLGAIREVDSGVTWFKEAITHFERPYRMDYQVLESRPKINHEMGRVDFSETEDGGTLVVWTSVFTLKTPVVGRALEAAAASVGSRSFAHILKHIDKVTARA